MAGKENTLKIIWFFLGQHKIYFVFLVFLAILTGVLESLNIGLMYPIIDGVLNIDSSGNAFTSFIDPYIELIPINDDELRYAFVFILVAVFSFMLKVLYYYLSVKFSSRIVKKVKSDIFSKCMNADYQFFIDNKQGEILFKTSSAPMSIASMLRILSDIFIFMFLSLSVLAILFIMSWKLIIVLAFMVVIYYLLIHYISTKVSYISGKKQRDSSQKERVIVTEYANGIKQIKVFETYEYWKEMFDRVLDTFWIHHRKNFFWSKFPEILLWATIYITIGAGIIIIKLQYPGRFMSILPLVGTFAGGILIILPKISQLGRFRMVFMNLLPNVESVYELLKDKSYEKIVNGTKEFVRLKKGIILKNVTFNHKERDVLLDDINLEIAKDKTTALVGPSGSGKSTIVNLLLRLYDVQKGGIYIDDINIKECDIFSFLKKVGFVSQDTFVYNASVKDNIVFGGEYSKQEILEASKMANAYEFIQNLPEGYDTVVGDRGMRLSGGEKQRIAIARAMIRKPEILILDEATSSLDNISESVVQKAIDNVSKNCTTFIIAHRLSTVQKADVIHVLDDGKVVESGSHKELLRKKGKYYELYNIQRHKDEEEE